MSMRISTGQLYSGGVSGIQTLQGDLYGLQNQIDTGRRVVTPKDDPVGAAQALLVSQSKSVNELYIKNQESADTRLSTLEGSLGGFNTELANIYEKVLSAGNGSYSDSERAAIGAELKERLGNLVTMANAQDGTGRYIFAGFKSTTQPFTLSGNAAPYSLGNPYVTYNGDDGVQTLQVSASQTLSTNLAGSEVFMRVRDSSGNVTGRSVFDAVQNLVNFMNTAGASASSPAYTQAMGDIQSAMDTISRSRATVGSRLSSLDSLKNMAEDRGLQYKQQLSNLQDLDYAKALTDVSQKKTQLEAAQATFAATSKLSLFDYI